MRKVLIIFVVMSVLGFVKKDFGKWINWLEDFEGGTMGICLKLKP